MCDKLIYIYIYIYLLLKSENMGYTAINGVPNPSQRLITESYHGVEAAVRRSSHQQFGGVTSSEHPVHGGEVGGALIGVEIWCKNATFYTLPPKVLARTTRPTAAAASTTSSAVTQHHTVFLVHFGLKEMERGLLVWMRKKW